LQVSYCSISMKKIIVSFLCFSAIFCTDQETIRREEAKKAEIKRKEIFEAISTKWDFKPIDFSKESYNIIQQWPEWNNFYHELLQKPQTDIGAFQRKTTQLVKQTENLQTTIPYIFDKVEIQSRFSVLATKLQLLKTYITVDDISTEKVIKTLTEINTEIESIANRMKIILEKNKIKREEEVLEALKSLDSLQKNVEFE